MFNHGYARLGRLLRLAAIPLTIGFLPNSALADCVNPTATEGRLIYNSTSKVVQFCDGTNWIGMGGGGGGGGSSSLVGLSDVDAASAGTGNVLVYNAVSGNWESVAVGSDTQIIFNDGGTLSGNAGLVFDKTNVRVGVGVATPTQPVDVAGLMTSDGLLLKSVAGDPPTLAGAPNLGDLANVDTSGAANGLVLKYNGTSSQWEAASDATGGGGSSLWTAAGSDIYYNSGNVGIGTTTPDEALHISGGTLKIQRSADTQASDLHLTGAAGTDGWFVSQRPSTARFGLVENTTGYPEHLTVLPGGNVGIGITSPTATLTVNGTSHMAYDVDLTRRFDGFDTGSIVVDDSTTTKIALQKAGGGDITGIELWAGTIYATGNVGIGTTSPDGKLHVATSNNSWQAFFGSTSDAARAGIWSGTSGNKRAVFGTPDTGTAVVINTAGTDRVWVAAGGRVGIGTTNPDSQIHVPLGGHFNGIAIGACPYAACGYEYETIQAAPGTNIRLLYGGTERFTFGNDGTAYKPGGGSWAATSDARLKSIDGDYDAGLEEILSLHPVLYHYRKDNPRGEPSDRQFVGLVAQEAMKFMPELVSARDDGFYNLDPSVLTYAFINAFKELNAENDNLRAALKSANDDNAAAIRALREELAELKASRR